MSCSNLKKHVNDFNDIILPIMERGIGKGGLTQVVYSFVFQFNQSLRECIALIESNNYQILGMAFRKLIETWIIINYLLYPKQEEKRTTRCNIFLHKDSSSSKGYLSVKKMAKAIKRLDLYELYQLLSSDFIHSNYKNGDIRIILGDYCAIIDSIGFLTVQIKNKLKKEFDIEQSFVASEEIIYFKEIFKYE